MWAESRMDIQQDGCKCSTYTCTFIGLTCPPHCVGFEDYCQKEDWGGEFCNLYEKDPW